jgi:hypothetical protein
VVQLRPKQRHAFGRDMVVPNDLLRDTKGRPVPADQWWRLCPVKRQATVRGGHVELVVKGYTQPFRFQINGLEEGLHLDHGYQVLVAFHPGRPEEGCHIFNLELGARNRDGFRRAEKILVAAHAPDAPQVDLSGRADFSPRRRAAAAVQRNFRAIGQARRTAHAQNSGGLVLRAESNGSGSGRSRSSAATAAPAADPGARIASLRLAPRERTERPPLFRAGTEERLTEKNSELRELAEARRALKARQSQETLVT